MIITIVLVVALVGWIVSTTTVTYGIYSLVRYWGHVSLWLKFAILLVPLLTLVIYGIAPSAAWFASFPFGIFALLPAILVVEMVFQDNWFAPIVVTLSGALANACGVVGVIRKFSKRFGYR